MKILVADDSAVLRGAVTKLLEPAGFEVVAAEDGVDAITQFYDERPDLVLLDVQMPKLNGYVVCRLIKEDVSVSHIPVLILTARDTEGDRYWGEQSGADGYLTKDTLGDGLVTAIRSALATRALTELSRGEFREQPVLGETDVLTRVCEMLDRKLFEATVVNELTAIGNRSLGLFESIDEILFDARRLVKFDVGAVVLLDSLKLYLRADDEVAVGDIEELRAFAARKLQSIADRELNPADLQVIETQPDKAVHADGKGWSSYYATSLRVRGRLLGLLVFASHTGGVFSDPVIRTLRTIEPAVASVIDSAERFQQALAQEARTNLSALSGF